MMSVEEAASFVRDRFPIEGYMSSSKSAYSTIAGTVQRYLQPGARILDFGCGPADKTAILQRLGYQCSGCDDLQEDWHRNPGQRDTILNFVKDAGIDFRLLNGGPLPFEKNSFDMVMLHDVMEHLHDSPRDLLIDLLELTTPEGLLFITVPNQVNIKKRLKVLRGQTNLTNYATFYWSQSPWRGHIREYVRDDLVKLCEFLDLDALELRGVDHMLQRIPAKARMPYLAVTKLLPDWKDSWLLMARKKKGWQPRRSLSAQEQSTVLPNLHW
jgi:2-polyprenyl-3-methyl-5-hydroxy-6-metoxy-1,4-benzoquinol methylase